MVSLSGSVPQNEKQFLTRTNIIYSFSALFISISSWLVFKHFYPYPNLTFDSYYYLKNMQLNTEVAGWPVGYSKFIRWFGLISHSANVFTALQFATIQLGFLYFFLTIRIIFKPSPLSSIVIFLFLFINPINIFGSNHILSDPFYIGISVIWITYLIWIIFDFKPYMIFTQAILLFLLFDLRYNALYLPIIALFVYLCSNISYKYKIAGICFMILLLGSFILYTRFKFEETIGVKQYAYSNGWKQASNGLYIYEHYYKEDKEPVPAKFSELDKMVREYFNRPHTNVSLYYPDQEITLGSFYMAVGGTPLVMYMQKKSNFTEWSLDFHKTAPYGPLYKEYGNYLIMKHPIGYVKYVVLPHLRSYFIPYPEIYTENHPAFSLWDEEFGQIAKNCFNLTTLSVPYKYIEFRANLLSYYPFLYACLHVIFLLSLLVFISNKDFRPLSNLQLLGLYTIVAMCLGNLIFTILSTTSVLRYQQGIIALEFSISIIILELIWESDKQLNNKNK